MMPTAGEGAALVPDEPIPEVEAELEAADHEQHAAFLAVVRGMVHGTAPEPDSPAAPADPSEVEALTPREEDLGDCLPGLRLGAADDRGAARTRRERRRSRALARDLARATREASTDPRRRGDGEPLGDYLARVEAPRLPRRARRRAARRGRRAARTVLVALVIGACAALPWAAPQVPDLLSRLVPGGGAARTVADPPVAPPSDAFVGPVGVSRQAGPYDGVRLEAAGPPREVVVERLRVDSRVVPISGQSGTLLPPSDPQVLGWWQEGRQTGARDGVAVVTGHTVHTGGGALDHLDKLVVGDVVRVRTDHGWITYSVQRNRIYSKAALAREAVSLFRADGPGRLLLITCDDWNGRFYESNAVVVAVPVDDQPIVSERETAIPDRGPASGRAGTSGNMEGLPGVVAAKMFDR